MFKLDNNKNLGRYSEQPPKLSFSLKMAETKLKNIVDYVNNINVGMYILAAH